MEQYKIGKTPIEMPTGWHDVNYNKAIKILTEDLNEIQTLALLTGRSEKEIRTATDTETIFYFMNAFLFVKGLPQKINEFPRSVKLGADRLIFPFVSYADEFDLGKADVGQVEDMLLMITKMNKEFIGDEERILTELELIQITPFLVAIYLQKILDGKYNGEKALKLVDRVKEELSFKEVVSIGTFFLSRLPSFNNGHPNLWRKYNSKVKKLKRGFLNLIQRLVSLLP